jgi:tRNA-specific 2-thiouridylase
VIDNFCAEYKRGRTPNPCVRCNQFLKFESLRKKAQGFGARQVATGHYAQIEFDTKQDRWLLKKGRDAHKDQSYFLYTLTQEQLGRTLMPLGKLTKEQTRRLAKEFKFHVHNKKESQEICFVPDNNYNNFIREYLKEEINPGSIMDRNGKVIGEHKGIHFYTVGQRKGLNLAPRGPYYVVKIDAPNNTIVVGRKEQNYGTQLIANNLNWISIEKPSGPIKVTAKVRYNSPESPATVEPMGKDRVKVTFEKPQLAIAPGQSVVFYDGEIVVGGGLIE